MSSHRSCDHAKMADFAQRLAHLVRDTILHQLVEYLNTREKDKGEYTVEELISALESPGVPLANADARKGTRRSQAAIVPDDQRCAYIFTRGRNKNERCPNRREPGQPFCSSCKGKKTAQTRQDVAAAVPDAPKSTIKLQVRNLSEGLYLETNHNLVLKPAKEANRYICCGVHDPETGKTRDLDQEEKEICKRLGLSYVDTSKKSLDNE